MPDRRRALFVISSLPPVLGGCSGNEEDVGAVEDLMREHGILRRAILVFRESAGRLRQARPVDASALHKTAQLFPSVRIITSASWRKKISSRPCARRTARRRRWWIR